MSTPAPGVSAQIQCPLLGESAQAPGPGAAEAATADNGSAAPAACPVIQQRSGQLTCPVCGSLRTHRSRRRGLLDRMIVYIGGKIRRCDVCSTRFVRFGGSTVLASDLGQANRRVVAVLLKAVIFFAAIFAGVGVIAFVWSKAL